MLLGDRFNAVLTLMFASFTPVSRHLRAHFENLRNILMGREAQIIGEIQAECESQLSVIANEMDANNRAMESLSAGDAAGAVPAPPQLTYQHHAQLQSLFPIYEPEILDYLKQHGDHSDAI
jgi:hypothetical protein